MDYSVIIPHYNSPKLLLKLLSSIPDKTNIEVIIVDDGSSPECVEELRNTKLADNVHLLYDTNGGAGHARNTGLRQATGKKIIFADADDYFGNDFIHILNDYVDDEHDIVVFGVNSVFCDSGEQANRHTWYMNFMKKALLSPTHKNINKLLIKYVQVWGKIYSADFLKRNEICFENVIKSNDTMFCIKCGVFAESVKLDNREMYIVTVTPSSLTNRRDKDAFFASFNTTLRANNYLRTIGWHKYQFSVLYFLGTAYKYGIKCEWMIIKSILKHRSNIFIGLSNLLHYKEVLKRHHPILTKKTISDVRNIRKHKLAD